MTMAPGRALQATLAGSPVYSGKRRFHCIPSPSSLCDALGPLLSRCYLAVRRSEASAFDAEDADFEIRNHFYRF